PAEAGAHCDEARTTGVGKVFSLLETLVRRPDGSRLSAGTAGEAHSKIVSLLLATNWITASFDGNAGKERTAPCRPPALPSSVDANRLPRHKSGLIGGKKGDDGGDLFGTAETADRYGLGALGKANFEIVAVFAPVGADRAGCADGTGADRIDG